jgi:hypothetical protein
MGESHTFRDPSSNSGDKEIKVLGIVYSKQNIG